MHPEQARLLEAVCASPEGDDVVRLAYADWLEEHGDEARRARAEFIRLQIQLARMDEGHSRWDALEQRAAGLLREHLDVWEKEDVGRFPSLGLRDMWGEPVYERGFARRVYVHDLLSYLDHYEDVPRYVPAAERLLYWRNEPNPHHLDAFFAFPRLAGVTGVKLAEPGLCLDSLQQLFDWSADPGRVAVIDARDADLDGPALVELIASSYRLRGLRWLDLAGKAIGDVGLQSLAGASHLSGLRGLALGADEADGTNLLTDYGVVAFVRSPYLAALEHLDLSVNDAVGPASARALAQSAKSAALRSVDLTACALMDEGVVALARSPHLTRLRQLRLSHNGVTDRGGEALAGSLYLGRLARLELAGATLSERT